MAPLDSRLLELAVREGLLTPEQAQEAARAAAGGTPVGAVLVERGWLGVDARDGLLDRLQGGNTTGAATLVPVDMPTARLGTPAADTPTVMPPSVPPRVNLPRRLGPYVLGDELGHGGMGIVFRARHEKLGSACAVKVMIAGEHASGEAIARFQREAATVARMGKHPNIVTVFDLGQEGALAYYAMELVEGKSLRARMREHEYTPEESAALVEKVARAVHFAHGHGVIHRDLKPENIVVREDPSAGPGQACEPQVMDFGLARDVSSEERLSAAGQVMGTLGYMAPEQARGDVEAMDARTDVYALGGVLYDLLTGIPPHRGNNQALLLACILRGDIVPPRRLRSDLPRDLETVCMKALALEPSRRYATAEALAEDLARFQRREPVTARRVTWAERAWRRVKRSPVVSALAAGLVVAALALGGVAWRGWQRDRSARESEQRLVDGFLRELTRSGGALVDAALARRAMGDLPGSRRYAAALTEPIEELKRLAPRLAEPWYHEGRMARATGRFDESERAQDQAIARARALDAPAGSRAILPWACYERGVLRASRYRTTREERRRELLQAAFEGPDALPPEESNVAEVEATFPELAELRRAAIADLEEAERARPLAARGILAVLRNDDPEHARKLLEESLAADPYLDELYTALASLAESDGDWGGAARWHREGKTRDRGFVPHVLGLATALRSAAIETESAGGDGSDLLGKALGEVEEALRLDDALPELWVEKAVLLFYVGQGRQRRCGDAVAAYAEAREATARALSLSPNCGPALGLAPLVTWALAGGKADRGEDPTADLAQAIAGFEGILATRPDDLPAMTNLAIAHRTLGNWIGQRGKDPMEEYGRAIEGYEAALAQNPRLLASSVNLANVYLAIGEWKKSRGEDPMPWLVKGLATVTRTLALAPEDWQVLQKGGDFHLAIGDWIASRGKDPLEAYDEASSWYARAAMATPRRAEIQNAIGNLAVTRGEWKRRRGEDPSDDFARALEGYERAILLHPRYVKALLNAAITHQRVAEWKRQRGEDPRPEIEKALSRSGEALASDPRWAPAKKAQGDAHNMRAEATEERGGDPRPDWADAIAEFEEAISLGDSGAGVRSNLAGARFARGEWLAERGQDPTEDYEAAFAGYRAARERSPGTADIPYNEAAVHEALGNWKKATGEDPRPDWERAIAAYDEALSIRPTMAEGVMNRGLVFVMQGRWKRDHGQDPSKEFAQAMTGYEKALELRPGFIEALANVATLKLDMGRWKATRGTDPVPDYREALVALGQALEINPRAHRLYNSLGNARRTLGEARGEEGEEDLRAAVEAHGKAVEMNAAYPEGWNGLGADWRSIAGLACRGGGDAAEAFARSVEAFERALSVRPRYADAAYQAGVAYQEWGVWKWERGEDASGEYAKALTRTDEALTIDPTMWMAHANRGAVLEGLGRFDEAVAAYEEALKRVGDGFPALRAWRDRARAKASGK